jgi:hypothetical protein
LKEPHFQAEAAEMVEAAKPETPAPIMIAIELYYALPSGRGGLQIVCHFRKP